MFCISECENSQILQKKGSDKKNRVPSAIDINVDTIFRAPRYCYFKTLGIQRLKRLLT